jgi:hypothetical protein
MLRQSRELDLGPAGTRNTGSGHHPHPGICKRWAGRPHVAQVSSLGRGSDCGPEGQIAAHSGGYARGHFRVRFYRELAQALGLRVRAGYRFEHLAVAGGTVIQGLMMRQVIARNAAGFPCPAGKDESWSLDALINDPLPGPGLDGGNADWSFAAAAYLGIFEHILEPDPDSPFSPPEAVQPA